MAVDPFFGSVGTGTKDLAMFGLCWCRPDVTRRLGEDQVRSPVGGPHEEAQTSSRSDKIRGVWLDLVYVLNQRQQNFCENSVTWHTVSG